MIKKISLILGFILLIYVKGFTQIITSDPVFPQSSQSLKIIYDASEGNQGLMDYSGDIWAHTGVITDKSSSLTNWKYVIAGWSENTDKAKLTPLGNNKFELQINPSIREFYGVPENEIIKKIAFVFRNQDGSKTGRSSDGSDIFTDVYEDGLAIEILTPDSDYIIVDPGENISLNAVSISSEFIAVYHDNEMISRTNESNINLDIIAKNTGEHTIKVEAIAGADIRRDSIQYLVKSDQMIEELPEGYQDGINYIDHEKVALVLFAPHKEFCFAIGDFSNWEVKEEYFMKKTPDGNRFWIEIDQLEPLKEYIFQYFVDGEIRIADQYTDKISDPWNDRYISNNTYPDLIDYPEGKTSQIASVFQTGQSPFEWQTDTFEKPPKENLIIYEMLLRDFIYKHDYKTLIDTLDYLENLGVNAIELMPVSEFEGNDSWGYNPSFYFAPDKYYGPKEDLKAFIDTCHERGIAVILDMVLNHSYGQSPMVRLYWDALNNQPSAENPWFNQESPNTAFSWGYDFNHESEATQAFVDRVNNYWLSEYRFDGFRFDFTKGFTNKPGDGGAYDSSRIGILKRMADNIWANHPEAYVILEHFADNREEKELSDYGMMIWGNMNYNYRKASSGYFLDNKSDFSRISYQERDWQNPLLVGYMESHDEERLMYECYYWGNQKNVDYQIKDTSIALGRMELDANFFIPIPGPKMIWMFGELGYDYSINYNGRVGRKPIRWDYADDWRRNRLYKVYASLNKLKKSYPVFTTDMFEMNLSDTLKTIDLNSAEHNVKIIGNYGIYPTRKSIDFPHSGWWYEYWTGDSVFVENANMSVEISQGEYRIYSDIKMGEPDVKLRSKEIAEPLNEIEVFPNPFMDSFQISLPNIHGKVLVKLCDNTGKVIDVKQFPQTGNFIRINPDIEKKGIYFLNITVGNKNYQKKIIKQ